MITRFGPLYDDISNIELDTAFIAGYLSTNTDDLEQAKIDLLSLYWLEFIEQIGNIRTPREANILSALYRRNEYLVEREYLKNTLGASEEENLQILRVDIQSEKLATSILNEAIYYPLDVLWGKKRDKKDYEKQRSARCRRLDGLEEEYYAVLDSRGHQKKRV